MCGEHFITNAYHFHQCVSWYSHDLNNHDSLDVISGEIITKHQVSTLKFIASSTIECAYCCRLSVNLYCHITVAAVKSAHDAVLD